MMIYVVCYDIEDDRERLRVARCLETYGERVQYSVFEVHLRDAGELSRLQQELRSVAGECPDIRFYRLTADALAGSCCLNGDSVAVKPAFIII